MPFAGRSRSVSIFAFLFLFTSTAHAGALSPTPAWMAELFQVEARFGGSVDSAGDVNGDGFDDVIVGAWAYDSPNSTAGRAQVYYGNASGVSATPAWGVNGPGTGSEFGTTVAGAGDVNGDGYGDVLVAAMGEDLTCCYNYQGAVYLYLGSATGLSTSAARSYGPGPFGFSYFGQSLTALGDVNGDGYADFAAGAREYSNGQSSEGGVFVYYGAATPPSAPSLIIEGNVSFASLGTVGRAGDVNGDGFDDVIVRTGRRVQIHYGSASGVSSTASWTADPSAIAYDTTLPIEGGGDVNGDGYDDVMVTDFVTGTNINRVLVYHGSASGPATTPTMTLASTLPSTGFGSGLAGVGDVDGDGYGDVVITAASWSNGQSGEGRAFLHRGGPSGLSANAAWTAESNYASGGMSPVAEAGDVNNDGLADVILGASRYGNHGAAYVFTGTTASCTPPASGPASLVATATANSELTLNWTTVAGAHHYNIYRALAACGSGTYARIGETETNIGTYVDRGVLPGGLYSYVVTAATAANVCESGPSPCDDETVTGTCTAKPIFTGVQSVTPTDCGLVLSWSPAQSACPVPGNIRYNIYRDTNSSFSPSSSNRIASCVSGTSFTSQMSGSSTQYFVVRAEENGCTGANEETNFKKVSGATILSFFDDLEEPRTPAKDARFATTGSTRRSTCKPYSGTYSYRFAGPSLCNSYGAFEENTLVLGGNGSVDPNINGFRIPLGWSASLSFQHFYSSVSGRDGALLQYSTASANGPWDGVPNGPAATGPYISSGGYNGTILSGTVPAWTGTNSFFGTVTVNLNNLGGNTVWFRWIWKTAGSSSANGGYYVDQVSVSGTSTTLQSVSLSSSGPTTFCSNATGAVVTANPNGGGPWMYTWGYRTVPGGPITTIASFQQKSHTLFGSQFPAEGTYYVVATVRPNCGEPTVSSELPVTVAWAPNTPAVTASGPTTFCQGSSVTLTAPDGYTYLWAPGGETTRSIAVTQSGSYSVTVSSAANCSATSAATAVTVHPAPAATITPSGPTAFCEGGSVTLTASSGASWLWSTGETTQAITVNASGSYSVTVTDANGCPATSAATDVTVSSVPATPVITPSGPTTFCDDSSVTLTAPDGFTYLWSNGATTQSITIDEQLEEGSYSVTVTSAGGCSATSAPTEVTLHATPDGFVSDGEAEACAGQPFAIQGEIGTDSPVDIVWSDGFVQHLEHPHHFTRWVVPPDGTSSWSIVSITNANGCSGSVPGTLVITAIPSPQITIDAMSSFEGEGTEIVSEANGVVEACGLGPINLVPTLDPSYSYEWADQFGPVSGGAVFSVADSGTYTVTATAPNGCTGSSSVTVNFTAYPAKPAISASTTELCPAGGSVTLTASAAGGWLWSTGETTQSIVVTAPGPYTVRARTNLCLSQPSDPVVITTGTSSISTSDSLALCEGGSATLTANDGTSWLWSTGATTRSIVATEPGTYTVTTTNDGCSMAESAPVTLTQRSIEIVPAGPTTFCSGSNVRLDASGGTSWVWSNGATTESVYVTESGSYTVTATFADGCSITSDPVVVDVRSPVATIAASGPTAVCPGGSIAFTSSISGDGTFTYQWFDDNHQPLEGQTSPTLSYSPTRPAGYVYLKVTDEIGCEDTSNAVTWSVIDNPQATITALGDTTFCEGGSVTLQASEGSAYSWSTGATTREITVSAGGTYSVTVTGPSCGLTSSAGIDVTVNPVPDTTITALGPTTFCAGGSVTLRAAEAASYFWSTGATTREITVSASGSYSVSVDNGLCSAAGDPVTVTVNPLPAATVTPLGATTFCEGGSVTLRASDGASWLWSNGATTRDITVSASGSYSVSVSDGTCSATSAATAVTVNPLPAATITPLGATTFCDGGSVTLRASDGASWLWSNGATTRDITVSAAGSYTVTVSDGTCSATSTATTVTVNPLPAAAITPLSSTTFCEGGSVTLRASQGASYLWSNGATTRDITVSASGSYTVTVSDGTCSATSSATTVTVNPLPAATITPLSSTTFCEGGSVTLRASQGASYLWSNGATTRDITVTASGSYTVTVGDGTCSATSAATAVTVNPLPAATITPLSSTTFCEGGSVTLRASQGASYLWSNGATTRDITVSASGSYTVTVSDGTCSAASSATTVTVNPLPAATITPLSSTTFCEGGSVTLRASQGASYLWSTGATTRDITVTASGSYTVTVGDGTCSATSSATTVTVNPLPAATITPLSSTTFCAGGSVTLRASQGASYLWSTGATTRDITVTAGGSYTVTVGDGTCSATSTATTVTVNPLPAATITPLSSTTFCAGGSVTLRASQGASYLWSTGATTRDITVNASGSYTVTVSDGTCSATSSATTVTVNPLPAATITPLSSTTFCEGGSVTLRASQGASYLWSTGATTRDITVNAGGSYTVTVNDGTCSATSPATTVTVNPLPAATITPLSSTTFCEGGSVTLRASQGASYLWSNGQTTRDITVNAGGSYTVTVSNGACSATSTATTVTVNPLPSATITVEGSLQLCPGASVTLRAPAGQSSYLWSNGATGDSITVSAGGSYSVTVTGANGCSRTSGPVTVTNLPATSITTQPANVTMLRNQTRQLSVVATGAGTLQYQWYSVASDGTLTTLAGQTQSTLTVGPYQKKGTYRYRVGVTSATCTGSTVLSNIATVTAN